MSALLSTLSLSLEPTCTSLHCNPFIDLRSGWECAKSNFYWTLGSSLQFLPPPPGTFKLRKLKPFSGIPSFHIYFLVRVIFCSGWYFFDLQLENTSTRSNHRDHVNSYLYSYSIVKKSKVLVSQAVCPKSFHYIVLMTRNLVIKGIILYAL